MESRRWKLLVGRIICLLMAIMILTFTMPVVQARVLSEKYRDLFAASDIVFWDPEAKHDCDGTDITWIGDSISYLANGGSTDVAYVASQTNQSARSGGGYGTMTGGDIGSYFPNAYIDAFPGRRFWTHYAGSEWGGQTALQAAIDSGNIRNTIVYALGGNDGTDVGGYAAAANRDVNGLKAEEIDALKGVIDGLGGEYKVVLVTYYAYDETTGQEDYFKTTNSIIKQKASEYGWTVADWAAVATPDDVIGGAHNDGSGSWDIHPNIEGLAKWTSVMQQAICGGCENGLKVSSKVPGDSAAAKIWNLLTEFMTDEQAAGVMGNMMSESGFNPAKHENSQRERWWQADGSFDLSISHYYTVNGEQKEVAYGLGLIQWSFGRRVSFLAYLKGFDTSLFTNYINHPETYSVGVDGDKFIEVAGEDVANTFFSLSIEFLKSELESNATYGGIFNQNTVESATAYFLEHVEIPENPTLSSHPERLTQAQEIYDQFAGSHAGGGTLVSNNGEMCGDSGGGAIQDYILKYAWPEYHSPVYVDRMPDYADVVEKRKASGQYVGGSVNGVSGIDCGGFVTTLMQESGFDSGYNGGNSNTDFQEGWVKSNGWKLLNRDESTEIDTSTLQPGDVAFTTGHTFVFAGDIAGFGSNIASASGGDSTGRAPMAGNESLTKSGDEVVRWYRKGN